MGRSRLTLSQLPDTLAISRLPADADIPTWALSGEFASVTKTSEELSVVCPQGHVPTGVRSETDYVCLQVAGPLDLNLTGILASLVTVLAPAGISVFVVSTFNTDYLLLKKGHLERAVEVLTAAGHRVLQ